MGMWMRIRFEFGEDVDEYTLFECLPIRSRREARAWISPDSIHPSAHDHTIVKQKRHCRRVQAKIHRGREARRFSMASRARSAGSYNSTPSFAASPTLQDIDHNRDYSC